MKFVYIVLVSIFSLCTFNLSAQGFKVGVSLYSKEQIVNLVFSENDTLEEIKKAFQKSRDVFALEVTRNIDLAFTYQKENCITTELYNSMINYMNYVQKEYNYQNQSIDNYILEIEAQILTSFKPIIDSILLDIAKKHKLNVILNKEYLPFHIDAINYTSEILSNAYDASTLFDIFERINYKDKLEQFENDRKIILSKSWSDFSSYETEN